MPLNPASHKKSTIVRSEMGLRITRASLRAAYTLSEDLGARAAARLFTTPVRYERPAREHLALARGRRFTVPVLRRAPHWGGQQVELAAWRWGHGPVALLVHGWEGRGAQLGAFIEPLVDAGMSVVAFDAPGHGDSPGHRLFLSDMADCIGQLVEHLGSVHALIAHSFGAAASLWAHRVYGVDAPRNVFVAPAPLATEALGHFARTLELLPDDVTALRERLAVESGVQLAELDPAPLAERREAGLLVVHDEEDREVGLAQAQDLVASWPAARLVTTRGLGHRRILRHPEVVRHTVEYATHAAPVSGTDLPRAWASQRRKPAAQ